MATKLKETGNRGGKAMRDGKAFTWVVSEALAGFNKGDTLSLDRQLVDYGKAMMDEFSELDFSLTDAEILQTFKSVNTEGLEPQQADEVVLKALEDMQEAKETPLADERTIEQIIANDPSGMLATAQKLGEKVDAAFDNVVNVAIDGKKDWDGAPLALLPHLERLYTPDQLSALPIVGTRKQGKKNKKGQSTDNVPEGYNQPTDHFAMEVEGETKYFSFVKTWIDNMPHVKQMMARKKTIKMVIDNDEGLSKLAIPDDIAKYMAENREDGVKQTHILDGLLRDATADVTNYHTRCSRALACWQMRHRIETEFKDNIEVSFMDGSPQASARRNRPIILEGRSVTEENGKTKERWIPQKPISLTKFLGLKLDKAKQLAGNAKGGVTLAHINKASERGTKKTTPTPNQQGASVALNITNVPLFGDVLASVQTFIDANDASIKHALAGPEGGLIASRIRFAYDLLSRYAEDKAVIMRAEAYDTEQMASRAAADAAKAAATKAEQKAKEQLAKAS